VPCRILWSVPKGLQRQHVAADVRETSIKEHGGKGSGSNSGPEEAGHIARNHSKRTDHMRQRSLPRLEQPGQQDRYAGCAECGRHPCEATDGERVANGKHDALPDRVGAGDEYRHRPQIPVTETKVLYCHIPSVARYHRLGVHEQVVGEEARPGCSRAGGSMGDRNRLWLITPEAQL
jgi:hypothetical protein